MRLRLVAPLLLGLSTAGAPLRAQGASPTLAARFDSLALAFLRETPAAGLTAAVVRGQDTLLLTSYGEADREARRAANSNTVYRIGSISKQFTAAAVMRLVEQGKIALDDPLTRHLPQYPQWAGVTVRHLLSHRSGIAAYTSSVKLTTLMYGAPAPAELVAVVADVPLEFPAGTRYVYSNTGYVLLGMILERVTGQSYARIMDDSIFRPLGMRSAAVCAASTAGANHASGYNRAGSQLQPAEPITMAWAYGAGDLCMNVPDFLRWQTALTAGRVVSLASYASMSASDSAGGRATGYGFGLMPGTLGTHRMISHGGDLPGFSTQQLWMPDDSLRVVVFTNTFGSMPDRLAQNLARAAFGMPVVRVDTSIPLVDLPPAERAQYAGTFDLIIPTGVFTIRVFLENGVLMAQAEGAGQGKFALEHHGSGTFGTEFDATLRLTIVVERGTATRAVLLQRGTVLGGPRRQ